MEGICEETSCFTPRRGQRQRKLSLKALESSSQCSSASVRKIVKDLSTFTLNDSESKQEAHSHEIREKPKILHNVFIGGDEIFSFQTRKKCEAVIDKIPKDSKPDVSKTSHNLSNKLKNDIVAKVLEDNDSSYAVFSDSGSEYVASTDESETMSDSTDNSGNKTSEKFISSTHSQVLKRVNKVYKIKADDYFSNHSTKKILTSNHTLEKLDTPRLPQDELQKLLLKTKQNERHQAAIVQLFETNQIHFDKWMFLMHENVNILLFGLGSKSNVLNSFHEKCLNKFPTIVINGFFPSLTIKDVLDGIVDLLELKENPSNIYEACDLVESEFNCILNTHLYIIVHNIDMIKNSKTQNVFARLATVTNIHLIASIDHINAPLIWDHSKLAKFNFTWWDVTTFEPYMDETSFESSMMVQKTGTLALSSLRNVFLSLTSNSKGIYLILVKYQIDHSRKQYYQGLAFKELYSLCREAFLVSSDLALRAQLTEFVDHKMMKFKRSADGTEYLVIPIANTLLQQFLTEQ